VIGLCELPGNLTTWLIESPGPWGYSWNERHYGYDVYRDFQQYFNFIVAVLLKWNYNVCKNEFSRCIVYWNSAYR